VFIRSFTIGSLVLVLAGCGGGDSQNESGTAATGNPPAPTGTSGTPTASADPTIPGTQRAEFAMDSFVVPAGGEYYKCQDFPNTFGGDIAIVKSNSTMTVGSHHMFVFRLSSGGFYGGASNLGPNNTKGPLVDCPSGGVEFHPYVHASQTPDQTFTYPSGIGQAFNQDETIRVMVHYLNTTTSDITASVGVKLDYEPAAQAQQLAASIFLNSVGIKVPPGTSTQGFDFTLGQDINLLAASGHMHRRGTNFVATATNPDGTKTQLYQTNVWDEPTAAAFTPAMTLGNGTGVHWACSYNNTTGSTLAFGESASTNEMCIFTGTFYPAPGGNGIYTQDFDPGKPE